MKRTTTSIIIVLGIIIFFLGIYNFYSITEKKAIDKQTYVLGYNDVSTAISEHNEIVIMDKTDKGYSVNIVLSDSVSRDLFNALSNRYYQMTKK